jgi:hypothetical protein
MRIHRHGHAAPTHEVKRHEAVAPRQEAPRPALRDGFDRAAPRGARWEGFAGNPAPVAHAARARLHGTQDDRRDFAKVRKFLAGSATGRAALKFLDRRDVNVRYKSGGGSFWDGKQIVLDRRESFRNTALTLVHEVEHAKSDLRGTSPGDRIQRLSRKQYVRQAIIEEVRGTVRSIDAKRELKARGVDTGNASFPLEAAYNKAYNQAVQRITDQRPNLSQARIEAFGRRAGRARVERGFWKGEVVTSNNGKTYPAYYGRAWDAAH